MRKIKFRAYDNQTKKFEYWDSEENKYDGIFWEMVKRSEFEKVEEYTGLKGSKRIEVYEGDICQHGDGALFKVEYHSNNCCSFIGIGIKNEMSYSVGCTYYGERPTVIGNIHENPELIKVGGER